MYHILYLRFGEVLWLFLLSGAMAAFAYRRAIQRQNVVRQLALLLAFIYLLLLLKFTLFPLSVSIPPFYRPLSSLLGAALPFTDLYPLLVHPGALHLSTLVRNVGGNIILFMPLGILLPLLREVTLLGVVKRALLLALLVELVQLAVAAIGGTIRIVSSDDILLNVTGAIAGYGIFWTFKTLLSDRTQRKTTPYPEIR